jgi:hypothetical protein
MINHSSQPLTHRLNFSVMPRKSLCTISGDMKIGDYKWVNVQKQ